MVLEFCNWGSLQDELDKRGHIPEADAVSILKQIILGLSECHRHNIIHRDLKPDNIFVHNGRYKVADLGYSKELEIRSKN